MNKRKFLVFLLVCVFIVFVISISILFYLRSDRYDYDLFIKETKVEYLNYKYLVYSYCHTSGFEDKVGMCYFVFDFEEKPIEFLEQFSYNSSFDQKYYFHDELNKEFEEEIFNKIQWHVGDKYNDIPDSYKLNFTSDYSYSNFPMFYFPDSKRLIIIQFILVR